MAGHGLHLEQGTAPPLTQACVLPNCGRCGLAYSALPRQVPQVLQENLLDLLGLVAEG